MSSRLLTASNAAKPLLFAATELLPLSSGINQLEQPGRAGFVDGGCNPATSSSAVDNPVSRRQPRRQEAQATSVVCACDGALCG